MYDFCPHCGETLQQQEIPGQMLVCQHCGQEIGVIPSARQAVVVDQTEELLRRGAAARCPVCQQVVEVRAGATAKSLAPHFAKTGPRKICPGSGKPTTPPAPPAAQPAAKKTTPSGKDLSAYMTRDAIKVVACRKDAPPTIEELILEYLDKADRVRLQIDALRDILGESFRLQDYPPRFNKPHLAVWSNAAGCVVAKKHSQGGYQALTDAEIAQVLADLQQAKQLFFS